LTILAENVDLIVPRGESVGGFLCESPSRGTIMQDMMEIMPELELSCENSIFQAPL
jgi:hypothetical protein